MESVVEKLADIEMTAEAIVEHAEAQKKEIEKEIQRKRDQFDENLESADEVAAQGTVPETSTIQEELSEDDYYVVKKGDTLDSISVKLYGDASHVTAICKMNGLSDGNLIYIGQKLLLP